MSSVQQLQLIINLTLLATHGLNYAVCRVQWRRTGVPAFRWLQWISAAMAVWALWLIYAVLAG